MRRRVDPVSVVAFLALATTLVFVVLIGIRNVRLGIRSPSIFLPEVR